ncbi:MAG: TolC family protein [Candidatus Binatia bacterium]
MRFFRRSLRVVYVCLWLALSFQNALADGKVQSLSLDLPTAIERALHENPELQAKRQALGAAQGRVQQADLLFQENPRLSVDADFRHRRFAEPSGRSGADVEVRLLQEIEIAGQRGHRREAAAAHLTQAEALVVEAERHLRREVAQSFYELLALHEAITVQQDMLAMQESFLQAGQRRFERGDISILELDTLRLDRDQTRSDIADQDEERIGKAHLLRLLLGVGEPSPLQLTGNIETLARDLTRLTPALTRERLEACAVEHRPDVKAARFALHAREAELRLAQARKIPNISIGPLYKFDNEDQVIGGALSIPLPFFNRNQHEITAAMANLQVDRTALDARILAVRHEVATALARLQLAARQFASYGTAYLNTVTESTAYTRKAYESGELSIFDFSATLDRLVTTRLRYIDAVLAYRYAMLELDAQSAFQCVDVEKADTQEQQTGQDGED